MDSLRRLIGPEQQISSDITEAASTATGHDVSYLAYASDGSPHRPTTDDAYVHVHVTTQQWPTGSLMVYLPDGTALVVPTKDLIHLVPADAKEARSTRI